MDEHHNWWGIGFMLLLALCWVVGVGLVCVMAWLNWRDDHREWWCEADAVGLNWAGYCTPDNPIHSSPCGWMKWDRHGKLKCHG